LSTLGRYRGYLLALAAYALVAGAILWFRPAAAPPLRLGSEAPEFRLPILEGARPAPHTAGSRALSELRGRVVFINFWATWCPPCRDEAPSLEKLYRRFRSEGLEVLAVSIDEAGAVEEVSEFREEFGLTFPILLDPERTAYGAYQVTGVPETFVVSPDGRLVEQVVGPRDWDQPRYATLVERLLGGPNPSEGAARDRVEPAPGADTSDGCPPGSGTEEA
jgi:peroxiredoxin